MKTLFQIVSLFFILSGYARSEVIEVKTITQTYQHLKNADVVIFDLDNTLLEPVQTLGSDQFFGYIEGLYEKQGLSKEMAMSKALNLVTPIQPLSKVKTVESIMPDVISYLQYNKKIVFALTSRPPAWEVGTSNQVASLGVDFSKTAPNIKIPTNYQNQFGKFINGIFFIAPGGDKGTVLVEFLKLAKISARSLVFIDDKIKNVESVDNALKANSIRGTEFRYGAADARVQSFDSRIANIELVYFLKYRQFMSDETAKKLLTRAF